jgi:catechol 2,3-dioxygenase-like lactoylglutathione lyase family enzyme
MLEKLDGVILAVRDADAAAQTFATIFGAEKGPTYSNEMLGADLTMLWCGTDVIALAVPNGDGPIKDHLDRWNEGIVGVAFAAKDPGAIADHIRGKGVDVTEEHFTYLLDPAKTHGLLTLITPFEERERVGAISFLYEVTHLVSDWQGVSDFWTEIFGLDGARFSPIESKQYGYEGMLTLFDPPRLLDRIEVVHPHDTTKAMGKFFVKRGEGPYMFFAECDDVPGLVERLKGADARFAGGGGVEGPGSLFVHPSATHGVLIGVSPTNQAWVWSGRPELAKAES